jgi:hypothetical protein
MPKAQKVGVFVLFGSGFICIAFATLRVVQLGMDGRGKTTTPEPKWMLLWTVLECSMGMFASPFLKYSPIWLTKYLAIIIGCSPAFAIFIRNRINGSKKASSDAHGYLKQSNNDEFKLKSMNSLKPRPKRENMDAYWDDVHSSQEELAKNAAIGLVRTRQHHDEEQATGSYRSWDEVMTQSIIIGRTF